jgi:ATP-dependent DNA helicase RecQ
VYAFAGASVEFIRRFEADYKAKPEFLTENYRSTAHIINAANLVIDLARNRMKTDHPITIDRARSKIPGGGDWQRFDPVGKGQVQILSSGNNPMIQAVAVMTELQRLSTLVSDWDWSGAAVIAKEWKFLDPVRSFCEINRIPVQMADEEAPHFWRLRETQRMVEWLRKREKKLVDTTAIGHWLDLQLAGPWWELLREAVEEYALETSGAELPVDHFFEWLAEWGREVRRRQTGLLLLTAHRAKGLEFDHVVVLDGAWEKMDRNADPDASRRLYYVAMTRAKKTLTLARFDTNHPLLDALPPSPSILYRAPSHLAIPAPELARQYQRLTMGDVNLGFAGGHTLTDPVHGAIAGLKTGDALQLKHKQGHWELRNNAEVTVGRLARAYEPPKDMKCIAASVAAIIMRQREDSEPEYRDRVRSESWEVVVPDLVFAPNP